MIDGCTNIEQLENAKKYINNAGLGNDELVLAWYGFKENLIGII